MPVSLPPTADRVERHAVMPRTGHDDHARLNFLAGMNAFLSGALAPGLRLTYERRARPGFEKRHDRLPETAVEVRDAMTREPIYQSWAALRRNTQEMSQQAARAAALKDLPAVTAAAQTHNAGKNTLALDAATPLPAYLAGVDNHLMPGSYYTEVSADDVAAGASYELSLFPVAMGSLGAKGDAAGRTAVRWVRTQFPQFQPKRILDLGAGIGGNTLPLADAFPDAEVVAFDAAAPMLRYGHARAQAMGYGSVRFVQGTIEALDPAVHGTFDWVHSSIVWHETSTRALQDGLRRVHAVMTAGALTTHIEQPNFTPETPVFDQFMRNWDAWYNNEPFWTKLHSLDMIEVMAAAGFDRTKIFDGGTEADIEPGKYQSWARIAHRHQHETKTASVGARNYKGERWYVFGAWK
jgi:SAM-dependent methyltransferase